MKLSIYVFFTAVVMITSCKSKTDPPEDLLPKPEMAAILLEIHLLEAKVNKRSTGRDSIQQVYEHYEQMLFADMGVDTTVYNASIKYYISHPEELSEIYEVVVDSLQVRSKNKELE